MPYRLIMLIAVIGLFQEAAAAEIDITHQSSAPSPSYVPISEGLTAPAPPVWFWTGFYGGLHLGVAAGAANFANPLSPSIFGDDVITPGFLAGGQIGFNWQLPNSNWVLGIEADASWLTRKEPIRFAFSGFFVSANCRARPNLMGDLTARVGWAYGQFNHSLLYVKGGPAYVHSQVDITTNNTNGFGLAPLTTNQASQKSAGLLELV